MQAYLSALADWLESAGIADPDQVRHELAFVGERTTQILTQVDQAARDIRDEARRGADAALESARAEAEQLRSEAEEEARRLRLEADEGARARLEEAESEAERLTDETIERRRALETLIGDLTDRRDEVLGQLGRIADEVGDLVDRNYEDEAGEEPQDEKDAEPPEAGEFDPDSEEQAEQPANG